MALSPPLRDHIASQVTGTKVSSSNFKLNVQARTPLVPGPVGAEALLSLPI